jgi:hypothetical protein
MKYPQSNLSSAEKLQIARERAEAAKEKVRLQEQAYFESISTGPKWKWFKIFSIYCIVLAAVITVETLVDGESYYLSTPEREFFEGSIRVEDEWYFPDYVDLAGFIDTTMHIVYSPIFGAPKSLNWTSAYQDSKTPLTHTYFYTWRYNSVYSFFPFIQIVLLIPVFIVWYRRPSPLFKFGRTLSIVLIFPASIYLLFVTFGIVNLLPFNI